MQINRWRYRCETCGKTRLLVYSDSCVINAGYDWEDTVDYTECWRCIIKSRLHHKFWRLREETKLLKHGFEHWQDTGNLKQALSVYKILRKVNRPR